MSSNGYIKLFFASLPSTGVVPATTPFPSSQKEAVPKRIAGRKGAM